MSLFYEKEFPVLRAYVLKNSGTIEDARDIFQEALMAVWLNIREGKYQEQEGRQIGAYVFRIAKNKWLDKLRSAQFKYGKGSLNESHGAELLEEEDYSEERVEYLSQLYARLDGKCRRILDKFYYEKKSLEEIADELGYDKGSVRTIKYRCMSRLRNIHQQMSTGNNTQDGTS